MPQSKKQAYEIVLTSTRVHRVRIEADSPEQACKALQRKIAGKPIRNTDIASSLVEDIWSDPSAEGNNGLWHPPPHLKRIPLNS